MYYCCYSFLSVLKRQQAYSILWVSRKFNIGIDFPAGIKEQVHDVGVPEVSCLVQGALPNTWEIKQKRLFEMWTG